jgi:hypothetical protein
MLNRLKGYQKGKVLYPLTRFFDGIRFYEVTLCFVVRTLRGFRLTLIDTIQGGHANV